MLAMVQDEERRGKLADVVAAIADGEVAGTDADALAELLELGLQTGRIRAVYGPEGEQAALELFRRLPLGRELTQSTRELNEALHALEGKHDRARGGQRSGTGRVWGNNFDRRVRDRAPARTSRRATSRPSEREMTYIIGDACIDVKDISCQSVCPVDCIHETERMLVIDPEECIDCGACEPECPVEAILPEDAIPAGLGAVREDQLRLQQGHPGGREARRGVRRRARPRPGQPAERSPDQYYMACLDVTGRRCLVVGGGAVGLEKAGGLVACGARGDRRLAGARARSSASWRSSGGAALRDAATSRARSS